MRYAWRLDVVLFRASANVASCGMLAIDPSSTPTPSGWAQSEDCHPCGMFMSATSTPGAPPPLGARLSATGALGLTLLDRTDSSDPLLSRRPGFVPGEASSVSNAGAHLFNDAGLSAGGLHLGGGAGLEASIGMGGFVGMPGQSFGLPLHAHPALSLGPHASLVDASLAQPLPLGFGGLTAVPLASSGVFVPATPGLAPSLAHLPLHHPPGALPALAHALPPPSADPSLLTTSSALPAYEDGSVHSDHTVLFGGMPLPGPYGGPGLAPHVAAPPPPFPVLVGFLPLANQAAPSDHHDNGRSPHEALPEASGGASTRGLEPEDGAGSEAASLLGGLYRLLPGAPLVVLGPPPLASSRLGPDASRGPAAAPLPQHPGGAPAPPPPAAKRARHQAAACARAALRHAAPPPPLSPAALAVPGREDGPARPDTPEGHVVVHLGDSLAPRFKVMSRLGEGTFGQVLECWDRAAGGYVAVKVVRAVPKYREAAAAELRVLAALRAGEPRGAALCASLRGWFELRGHVCMVFPRLGPSLYDVLRRNAYAALPLGLVRDAAARLLEAVRYVHGLGLVHTDLKPENVLLADCSPLQERGGEGGGKRLASVLPASHEVTLIDFGSAAWVDGHHSATVSTRHYRSPEVVLGLGWSLPTDIWSVGCILVELLTGDVLFNTHHDLEHLAMMEAALGRIPEDMALRARAGACADCFRGPSLAWPLKAKSRKSVRAVAALRSLEDTVAARADPRVLPLLPCVLDLLRRMLAFDPGRRAGAAELLEHPFFAWEG